IAVPASLSKWAHPPRLNVPRSSSSGPPGPCITPSTETCVVVVSFMVGVPFSLSLLSFDAEGLQRRLRLPRFADPAELADVRHADSESDRNGGPKYEFATGQLRCTDAVLAPR